VEERQELLVICLRPTITDEVNAAAASAHFHLTFPLALTGGLLCPL